MSLDSLDPPLTSTYYCLAEDPREVSADHYIFFATANSSFSQLEYNPDFKPDFSLLLRIYCLNPRNDDCPVGICPNPDIAGPLLRMAHYVTACCLTYLIFYAPKRVKDAFYYQMSNVYALLITCSVSLFQQSITRFHAGAAIFITSSPVSIYFLVYSIKASWHEHRLDTVLGKKQYLNRGLVFLAAGIWISIVVYISLESTQNRFAQRSCSDTLQEFGLYLFSRRGIDMGGLAKTPWFVFTIIAAFSWFVSIVLARKEIWPPGERYRPKFVTVWRTIRRRYPSLFFLSIGTVPINLWIWITEKYLWYWEYETISDTQLSLGFGQILALFIAVPPFLQVCQLVLQPWSWTISLPWIARCWKRKRRTNQSAPMENPDLSHETVCYTQLENPVSPEVDEGRQEMQESGMRLEPNRYHGP